MNRSKWLVATAGVLAVLSPVIAQSHAKAVPRKPDAHSMSKRKSEDAGRGERVFNQNCSRCHEAPQTFPPQISGTIVRHMRVRASLSAQDEKALLKFLNP